MEAVPLPVTAFTPAARWSLDQSRVFISNALFLRGWNRSAELKPRQRLCRGTADLPWPLASARPLPPRCLTERHRGDGRRWRWRGLRRHGDAVKAFKSSEVTGSQTDLYFKSNTLYYIYFGDLEELCRFTLIQLLQSVMKLYFKIRSNFIDPRGGN